MNLDPIFLKFNSIFLKDALDKRVAAENNGQRFVHYTGVEAAYSMLKNGEVWLRKSSVMNDFQEVHFGVSCLARAWLGAEGVRLKTCLDGLFPGISKKLDELLTAQIPAMQHDTYLACISEHHSEEDRLGRLSMWRAYGSVAFVLNPMVFMSTTDDLHVVSSPVAYQSPHQFEQSFKEMADRVEINREFLLSQGENATFNWLYYSFRQAIICTKHPGFKEELEWRLIYNPIGEQSSFIDKTVEVVRGVAQPIVKLKLRDDPSRGIVGLSPGVLVERIIIGPTQFPMAQLEAFATLLAAWSVPNPYDRVHVSDIPLRQ